MERTASSLRAVVQKDKPNKKVIDHPRGRSLVAWLQVPPPTPVQDEAS
jgi:hypothetical protein